MKFSWILAFAFLAACGGSDEETTVYVPDDDGAGSEVEAAPQWSELTSTEYGIRLSVPDPGRCEAEEAPRIGVGHLRCDHGSIGVDIFSLQGQEPMADLREAAVLWTDIPADQWEWQAAVENGPNGYLWSEAWTASLGDPKSCIGIIGQSDQRDVSHIIFICGDNAAFEEYSEQIGRFIESIHAI